MFLSSYTKALKSYDSDLYAGRTKDGVPCVFRKSKRFEPVCEWDGVPLLALIEDKQFIIGITDNWLASGAPREWGVDRVVEKVKSIDARANEQLFAEMDAENERQDKSRERSIKNEMEAFWSHERRRFAKATDGILTHSLSKDEPKKRLKDRSIKNGNY